MSGTADVLRKARKVIENKADWGRGELCDRKGRHCALGAVAAALGYSDAQLRAHERGNGQVIYDVLDEHPAVIAIAKVARDGSAPPSGYRSGAVYLANDRAEHHRVVLGLFDRAIAEAE